MKAMTATKPTRSAIAPALTESAPRSAPTDRCSITVRGAGSAPALMRMESSVASCGSKRPVMRPRPPSITPWIVGAEMICSSSTMAKRRPMFSRVISLNRRAPRPSKAKLTW